MKDQDITAPSNACKLLSLLVFWPKWHILALTLNCININYNSSCVFLDLFLHIHLAKSLLEAFRNGGAHWLVHHFQQSQSDFHSQFSPAAYVWFLSMRRKVTISERVWLNETHWWVKTGKKKKRSISKTHKLLSKNCRKKTGGRILTSYTICKKDKQWIIKCGKKHEIKIIRINFWTLFFTGSESCSPQASPPSVPPLHCLD